MPNQNNQENGNAGNVDYSIILPFIFFILDGSLLFSSFAAGFIGICSIHIASASLYTQQFLLKQRKNINIVYDSTNIDFNRLFHSINEISTKLYENNENSSVTSPLYSNDFFIALRLATDRVLFDDSEEETGDINTVSDINYVTDDEEEDEEDEEDEVEGSIIDDDSKESEIHSDTTSEEQNACIISTSSESVEENAIVDNDEDGEEENKNAFECDDCNLEGNDCYEQLGLSKEDSNIYMDLGEPDRCEDCFEKWIRSSDAIDYLKLTEEKEQASTEEEDEENNRRSEIEKIEDEAPTTDTPASTRSILEVDTASVPTLLNEEENKEEEIVDKHYLHKSEVAF